MSVIACKYCIMTRGLRGSEISSLPKTDEEFVEHIERDHNIPVTRPGETEEQTLGRFYKQYPTARNPETCKCPECSEKRKIRDMAEAKIEEN